MTIEITCKGCGQKLRVSDEHAGKQARCPGCKAVMPVPAPSDTPPGAANAADLWHVKLEDGNAYGPVPKSELDAWVAQGRITAATKLRRDGQPNWIDAGQVYPALGGSPLGPPAQPFQQAPPGAPIGGPNPFGETPQFQQPTQPNPYASPTTPQPAGYGASPYGRTQGYREPHRGGVILTLGILGIVCCMILGIIAWVMANEDLNKMRAGRMDPSGRGLTQAGQILGIISVVLGVIGLFVNVAMMGM